MREARGEHLLHSPEMIYDILTSLTPYKQAMEDREAVEQVKLLLSIKAILSINKKKLKNKNRHENTSYSS